MNSSSIIGSILIFLSLASAPVSGSANPDFAPSTSATSCSATINDEVNNTAQCLQSQQARYPFIQFPAAHVWKTQDNLLNRCSENPIFLDNLYIPRTPLCDAIFGPVTLGYFCNDNSVPANAPNLNKEVAKSDSAYKYKNSLTSAAQQVSASTKPAGAIPSIETGPLPGVEVTYRYDPKDSVVAKNVPDSIKFFTSTSKLPFVPFELKASFNARIRKALNDNTPPITIDEDTLAMIDKYSASDAYRLTTATLEQLKRRGASESLINRLNKTGIKDKNYADLDKFKAELTNKVKESESDSSELIGRKLHLIEDSRFQQYNIPSDFDDRYYADVAQSKPVAAVFSGLHENVHYPTQALLDSALEWRVDVAIGMCRNNRNTQQGRMADLEFVTLEPVLRLHQYRQIEVLRNITNLCDADQMLDSKSMAHNAYQVLSASLDRAAHLQTVNRVEAVTKQTERKSDWAAPSCGCARDASDGMIYGFYPLWTKAAEHQFNFGQLSRIGLVGMSADDEGELVRPAGMKDNPIALIAAAHTHMTKVDWVIFKNDWRNWLSKENADKTIMLNKLRENIGALLRKPLYTWDKQGTALASLGFDPAPTLGDGVTINFANFPEKDVILFNEFIKALSADLKKMKAPRQLNIMVSHSDMVDVAGAPTQIFGYSNLEQLIEDTNNIEKDTPLADQKKVKMADLRVLVLLAEHTIDSKKVLRSEIEYSLVAAKRKRLLRDVIPVIEYDGQSSEQMRDDIIYFADNFGGIGFWSPIFVTPDDEEGEDAEHTLSINRLLTLHYEHTDNLSGPWESFVSQMCAYRLWLRWAGWISLLLAASGAGAYAACCSCSERMKGNDRYRIGMIALMALPFGILFVLLIIDPLFHAASGIFLLIYANAGLIGAVVISRYYHLKSQRQIP